MRKAIEPEMKIAITLRHLAAGDNYSSIKYNFRVPQNTISVIVREVCEAIAEEYKDEVISCPSTPEEWRAIAEQFDRRWNVPHAVRASYGNHIAIRNLMTVAASTITTKAFCTLV